MTPKALQAIPHNRRHHEAIAEKANAQLVRLLRPELLLQLWRVICLVDRSQCVICLSHLSDLRRESKCLPSSVCLPLPEVDSHESLVASNEPKEGAAVVTILAGGSVDASGGRLRSRLSSENSVSPLPPLLSSAFAQLWILVKLSSGGRLARPLGKTAWRDRWRASRAHRS